MSKSEIFTKGRIWFEIYKKQNTIKAWDICTSTRDLLWIVELDIESVSSPTLTAPQGAGFLLGARESKAFTTEDTGEHRGKLEHFPGGIRLSQEILGWRL